MLMCLLGFLLGDPVVQIVLLGFVTWKVAEAIVGKKKEERLRQKQEEWNNAGKDVAVLHMFDRAVTCPNPSPFPLKLETYFRAAGIKYIEDFEEPKSTKSKSPWVTLNGENLADSQIILETIQKQKIGKDLDGHLTEEQQAVSRSLRILLEDHFYYCFIQERYVYLRCEPVARYYPSITNGLPMFLMRPLAAWGVGKITHATGIGRHTRPEVEDMGKRDLEAVSAVLKEQDYMFGGDDPTTLDFVVFGFVVLILYCEGEESYYYQLLKGDPKLSNLSAHCQRMKERYWPDWEQKKYRKL